MVGRGFEGRGRSQRKPLKSEAQHPSSIEGLVTAIEPQVRGGGRRANIFVDGRYALSLSIELAASLHVGSDLDGQVVSRLLIEDQRARAYDAGLRFLGARPRSEREIRDRLAKHQFAPEMIESTIERLRRVGLIDDAAFAEYWVEQRASHRPRGGRLLKQELRSKGIDVETAAAAVPTGEDETDGAYRAAARKAQSLRSLDEQTFRQRLGAFLQRRGFDYQTTRSVVTRLAGELGVSGQAPDDED